MKTKTFFLILIVFFSWRAFALTSQEPTPMDFSSRQGSFDLSSSLSILEDPTSTLTIENVSAESYANEFKQFVGATPNFGFTSSAIWVRMSLRNADNIPTKRILQVAFPLIDNIRLFVNTKEGWQKTEKGILFPFAQRGIQHSTFLFELDFLAGESKTVYMRFQSEDTLQIPLMLWSPEAFRNHDHAEQLVNGIYFGIVFVMAVYNFFLFFILRDKSHLSYVLYIVVFSLFLFSQYGLAYEYLWPNFNQGAGLLNPVLCGLLEFCVLLFTGHFLNLQKFFPLQYKIGKVLMVAALIVSLSSWFLPISTSGKLVAILGIMTALFILVNGAIGLIAGYRPARFFMAAFAVVILGAILYALKTLGIIPSTFLTNNGIQIGSAIEVTLLSLGLADRINILIQKNIRSQTLLLTRQEEALNNQKILTQSYARLVPQAFIRLLGRETILDVKPGDQVQQEMTVLFSDIRSFTAMSEKMSPKENFNFLNSYLRRMNPIIEAYGGYIDKYIGDGIMALFPNSPQQSLNAAIEMQKELIVYNGHRHNSGYAPISVGMGIHIGNLMFGTLGNESRMEVTVIADAVNLTSRIEQLCKEYGAQILISQYALERLQNRDEYVVRMVGRETVRGRTKHIDIYEVLDGRPNEEQELYRSTRIEFEDAVLAFLAEDYAKAQTLFEKVKAVNRVDSATQMYLERLAKFS